MALTYQSNLPDIMALSAGAINEALVYELEKALTNHIKPKIRTLAEETARELIGNANVHMERDYTAFGGWKVQVTFITGKDGA